MARSVQPRSSKVQSEPTAGAKVGAGAAGVGSGTLLVILANNIPEHNQWKTWLVLLAPSVTVAVGVVYGWIRALIERWLNKRELVHVIHQAKQTLSDALRNPETSEEHRAQLRKELEQLEMLLVRADLDRIRVLAKVDARL